MLPPAHNNDQAPLPPSENSVLTRVQREICLKGPVSGCVGINLCQRWTVEFKGITQPVLSIISFYYFVTPQKRNMSEGCWLFTLKMAVQSSGNSDITFR